MIFKRRVEEILQDDTTTMDDIKELFIQEEEGESFDMSKWLTAHNMTEKQLLDKRKQQKEQLENLGKKFNLPPENRYAVCCGIKNLQNFSQEVREFLALFLPHQNQLFFDDREVTEEEVIDYIFYTERCEATHKALNGISSLAQNWSKLDLTNNQPSGNMLFQTTITAEQISKLYMKIFGEKGEWDVFTHNIDGLLSHINTSPSLQGVAPLYIYQMLVKHASRMKTNPDMTVNYKSLWKYQEYEIFHDNGKNFNKNVQNIALFSGLCNLFENEAVNATQINLSQWGFMLMSNLTQFQREQEDLPRMAETIFTTLDNLLNESEFVCFWESDKFLDNMGLDIFTVNNFMNLGKYEKEIIIIINYVNENSVELARKFTTDCVNMEELCMNIYTSNIRESSRYTKTTRETKL